MAGLIEIKAVDREFYESRLRGFLPPRLIDAHAHVWLEPGEPRDGSAGGRLVTWPGRVAAANPVEHLLETYRLMLPGTAVTPLIFSNPAAGANLDSLNDYAAQCSASHTLPALALSRPEWTAGELEERILRGGFLGIKPYLSLAPASIPADEIAIFDFLPPHHLEVIDRRGWIVMLHLPRPARLRDPGNIEQLLEIGRRFPNARVIVAHVGRAYCPQDVGDAFERLASASHLCFDFSANTNERVFSRLLDAVGPKRVLFGTDMPILRMRMRRICENGRYINIVPRGLYGDVSGDPHMREVDGPVADRLTFFLYEEIDAFRRAARAAGLSRDDIEDVFHDNAARIIEAARG